MSDLQQFASDNYSGICPEAWAAMAEANPGHAPGYGEDAWTAKAADAFRALFETNCEVFFAFNGTAANSLALAALCQSYHGVICSDVAHVETDECGAPEFFSNGSKLLVAPSAGGKLTPDAIRAIATNRNDIHFPKPRVVTLTQPTETGELYSLAELRAILAKVIDRRERFLDAGVVRDRAVGHGNVEVFAHKHTFAGDVDRSDRGLQSRAAM